MFYSIEGKLLGVNSVDNAYIAIIKTNQGVAYEIKTTYTTAAKCERAEDTVELYTYLSVKDTGAELYGFYDKEEKEAFKLLLGVSGVGPKAAISILSKLTPKQIEQSISEGDIGLINSVKGIGRKTAQRIALELKDKFIGSGESDYAGLGQTESYSEAVSALVSLGYTKSQAKKAISGADANDTVENLVKFGLLNLQKQ